MNTEQEAFEEWFTEKCPSGDVEAVQRQWTQSSSYRDYLDTSTEQKIAEQAERTKELEYEITTYRQFTTQQLEIKGSEMNRHLRGKLEAVLMLKAKEIQCAEQAAVIEKLSKHSNLLVEAYNFGQFADDFNQPQASNVRKALRETCEALAILTDSKQILAEWLDKQVIGLSDLLAEVNKADAALSAGRNREALCAVRTAQVAASLIRCHVANRSLFKKLKIK